MSRRDEEGAVAVLVAVSASLLLVMAAFAADLGMQRVVRADLQALADVVALDLSRELDGRTQAELAPELDASDPGSALSQSVARNADVLGEPPTVTATLGSWDGLTFDESADPPSAVRVVADGAVDFVFRRGRGTAERTAIGTTLDTACYSLGSYAARFRSTDSTLVATLVNPMNEILRPQADLSLADYTALAATRVSVADLAAAAGLSSARELLTGTISGRQLLNAGVAALQRQSSASSAAVTALNRVLAGSAALDAQVAFANVVSMAPTDEAAMQTQLNLLDLVTGTILAADGTHGFTLGNGNLGAKVAGVASLTTASLSIVERPQTACGEAGSSAATARTSQLRGTATAALQLPTINLGGGDIVQTAPAVVTMTAELGNATGTLSSGTTCGAGTSAGPDAIPVRVQSGLATLSLSTTLGFRTTLDTLLGKVVVTWSQSAGAGVPMPDTASDVELFLPPNDTTPVSTGSGDAGLGDVVVSGTATDVQATLKSTGLPVNLSVVRPLLDPIAAALSSHADVDGRLDTLGSAVDDYLAPYATLLGLNVSGADVFAAGRPVCGAPVLRG